MSEPFSTKPSPSSVSSLPGVSPVTQGTTSGDIPGPAKKRLRVPNSCVVCRRRKIKCNKGRPACEECVKRGVSHLCHYDDPVWMNTTPSTHTSHPPHGNQTVSVLSPAVRPAEAEQDVKGNLEELMTRLKHVEAAVSLTEWSSGQVIQPKSSNILKKSLLYDPNETLVLHEALPFLIPHVMRKSRVEFHGALSPIQIIKRDVHLKVIWLHMWAYLEEAMMARNSGMQPSTGNDLNSGALNAVLVQFLELRRQKVAHKEEVCILKNSSETVENLILKYLPIRRVILALSVRFFRNVYPLIPVFDEHPFINDDLQRILGTWLNMNEKPTKLEISTKYDIALMGLLFAVMAIASLTISTTELETDYDFKHLKGTSTAMFINMATLCLRHYNFTRKSYIPKLIALRLLVKFYYEFCPEDDTNSDFSMGGIGLRGIISEATAMGLGCDPADIIHSMGKSPSHATCLRKIWHKITDMDATNGIWLGIPPHFLDDESYDVKLPEPEPGMDPLEAFVVSDFAFAEKKVKFYRDIAYKLFLRTTPPTVGQMQECIREIETFTRTNIGSLRSILASNPLPYVRVKKVALLLELSVLQLVLKVRLAIYFHQKDNITTCCESYKSALAFAVKLMNSALNVYHNTDRYFGHFYAFYIRPYVYHAASRVFVVHSALLARCIQAGHTRAHDLHGVATDELPKTNFIMSMPDPEINSLINTAKTDIREALQPLVGARLPLRSFTSVFPLPLKPLETMHHFGVVPGRKTVGNTVLNPLQTDGNDPSVDDVRKSISSRYIEQKDHEMMNGIFGPENRSEVTAPPVFGGAPPYVANTAEAPLSLNNMSGTTPTSACGPGDVAPVSLTSEEYTEVFGLFDEYNWLSTQEMQGFDTIRGL
ncbi:Multidrug resistance regulator 1 [Cyberlindnera fabianii]|uniref:Multidrug resistance regulator 1 n=1 Tax=Cyberlindnera fabianii TaxID=36022 RepID=A0A1V2LDC1_CYBFA|nr:Multidrug resistance regulator 1 [Cyberlindnera fabianii]